MSLKQDNSKKITKAFAELKKQAQKSFLDGMKAVLTKGVEYCLNEHDASHQRHLETGDSYGWMLFYNGKYKAKKIWAKGKPAMSNATALLQEAGKRITGVGYEGLILAGMMPDGYYIQMLEFKFMREGMTDLKNEDFDKYFKKIVI